MLYVDVTDTGAGADADKLNAYLDYQDVDLKVTHGFGIRNVNERLACGTASKAACAISIMTGRNFSRG